MTVIDAGAAAAVNNLCEGWQPERIFIAETPSSRIAIPFGVSVGALYYLCTTCSTQAVRGLLAKKLARQ